MFLKPSPDPAARDRLGLMVNFYLILYHAMLLTDSHENVYIFNVIENDIQFEEGSGNYICILFRFGHENVSFSKVRYTLLLLLTQNIISKIFVLIR